MSSTWDSSLTEFVTQIENLNCKRSPAPARASWRLGECAGAMIGRRKHSSYAPTLPTPSPHTCLHPTPTHSPFPTNTLSSITAFIIAFPPELSLWQGSLLLILPVGSLLLKYSNFQKIYKKNSANFIKYSGLTKWTRNVRLEDQNRFQGPHCLKIEGTHQIHVFISVFCRIGDHIWQNHCLSFIDI